jgi:hypothetical protein
MYRFESWDDQVKAEKASRSAAEEAGFEVLSDEDAALARRLNKNKQRSATELESRLFRA